MKWEELKKFGCIIVIHCNNDLEKQDFFEMCKKNGIFPFLSPFAIKGREHFKVTRSNGRLELLALTLKEIEIRKLEVIEWADYKSIT